MTLETITTRSGSKTKGSLVTGDICLSAHHSMAVKQQVLLANPVLKHQLQFPGSCCQIYLQNVAEKAFSGTLLYTCFAYPWKQLYLQQVPRNHMAARWKSEVLVSGNPQSDRVINTLYSFSFITAPLAALGHIHEILHVHTQAHTLSHTHPSYSCSHTFIRSGGKKKEIGISVETWLGVILKPLGKRL